MGNLFECLRFRFDQARGDFPFPGRARQVDDPETGVPQIPFELPLGTIGGKDAGRGSGTVQLLENGRLPKFRLDRRGEGIVVNDVETSFGQFGFLDKSLAFAQGEKGTEPVAFPVEILLVQPRETGGKIQVMSGNSLENPGVIELFPYLWRERIGFKAGVLHGNTRFLGFYEAQEGVQAGAEAHLEHADFREAVFAVGLECRAQGRLDINSHGFLDGAVRGMVVLIFFGPVQSGAAVFGSLDFQIHYTFFYYLCFSACSRPVSAAHGGEKAAFPCENTEKADVA